MNLARILMVILVAAAPASAQQDGQSGRFPVFGPSSEREAFFASQTQAREEAAEAIAEREAELAKARIAANAQKPKEEPRRSTVALAPFGRAGCYRTAVDFVPAPGLPGQTTQSYRWVCPRPIYRPTTGIAVNIDDGDVSGKVVIRRPGLTLGLGFD